MSARSRFAFAFAFAFTFTCAGCAHRTTVTAPVAATWEQTWKTMSVQHVAELTVVVEPGKVERRKMRALLAIERPGKFRMRALGPGGLTLFELVMNGADATVKNAIRDPKGTVLDKVTQSLITDLVAIYRLEPFYESHSNDLAGKEAIYQATGRKIRLGRFVRVGGHAIATRIAIEVTAPITYAASIDVSDIEIDQPLDAALFDLR